MTVQVPTVEEVAAWINKTSSSIRLAYEAEVFDQAERCVVEPYNPALAAALVRRVRRAMAIANVPLGVTLDENAVRVGSIDPEVRRLEAPYRKVVMG